MLPLSTDLFDYPLPSHLIAQTPAARRDSSRLLVVDRSTREISHARFSDLPQFLRAGDVLFRNNAAVLPARLHAQRAGGGAAECLLLRPEPSRTGDTWWCLLKPGKKLPVGASFRRGEDFTGTVLAKDAEGTALVVFTTSGAESISDVANRVGEVPLPPYIARADPGAERAIDLERYQTVYANQARQVAVAAPTAGLHFTPELIAQLVAGGVSLAEITLHVGLGTFRPISTDTIEGHAIHRETYEMPAATQQGLFARTGRRIAVGTTSVRSIEDFLATHAEPGAQPFQTETSIFIHPPSEFRGVDALITNFHQPRSTLLCLVAAFLTPGSLEGIDWLKNIYSEAVKLEYRFFSYGDAMLIL